VEKEIEMEREAVVIGAGGAVNSVNGQTGDVVLTTSDLENTSDYQNGTEVESAISTAIAGINIPTKTSDLTNDGATGTSTYVEDTALSAETTAREQADNALQSQIDAISASSDVTDIVGTKAELNAYDTSKLGDNDIIKVLQDESENGETTYYRWSTTTQSFTLIGEEGPYYTKAATDALLNAKQDTLTEGTGIDITNNVISATSAGPTVVQTTGNSTTDVMSQNATTSMVFADPSTKNRVQIGDNANAQASNTVSIGAGANASSTRSVAIGAYSGVGQPYSVALGFASTTSEQGEVGIGLSASYAGNGYNNSNYRLLTGLYDGQNDHDAVTVGQLNTAIAGAGANEISSTDWSALWQ